MVAGKPVAFSLGGWWLESHELCMGVCWNSGWTAIPSTTWLDSQCFYIAVAASFGKIGLLFWWPQKAMAHITANKDLQTIKLSCRLQPHVLHDDRCHVKPCIFHDKKELKINSQIDFSSDFQIDFSIGF